MKPTRKIYTGTVRLAAAKGSRASKMKCCTDLNSTNERVPASNGDISQLEAITPTLPHSTASIPSPTAPKPTTAPTIECVVETGQPLAEATNNHTPAANNAERSEERRVGKECR